MSDNIIKNGQEALLSNFIESDVLFRIEQNMHNLFEKVLPQIPSLIEGAHMEDKDHFSVLVPTNRDAYQKMYELAASNPLNAKDKLDGIDEYLVPLRKKLVAKM